MILRAAYSALCSVLLVTSLRADEPITVIKLSVQAQPAPRPALKHQLLPELRDVQQGNPVPAYYKCFMEQQPFYFNKESVENREKWQNCPLSELPNDLVDYGGVSLRQADYAARLDACDWQALNQLKAHGVMLLLPDLQQLRMLAAALKVRYRAQVKAGKFDEAIRTQQTMNALSRHLGEHPTLIGNLVGMAIANMAVGPFEEMIQQPGCPNLYWALTQLPSPLVEIRNGLRGERLFVEADFRDFMSPTRPWNDVELPLFREKARLFAGILSEKEETRMEQEIWVAEKLKDDKWIADAQRRLIAAGLPEASVSKYPPERKS